MHLLTTSEETILIRITNPFQVTTGEGPCEAARADESGKVLHKTKMVCDVGSCRRIPLLSLQKRTPACRPLGPDGFVSIGRSFNRVIRAHQARVALLVRRRDTGKPCCDLTSLPPEDKNMVH